MPIGDYSGGSTSSSKSSKSSGPAGGASAGGNYGGNSSGGTSSNNMSNTGGGSSWSPASGSPGTTTGGKNKNTGGGNDNTVDPGFQKALKEKAIDQQNPVYGDPDPEVDVDPQDRDSITSFKDNYIANVKSNPMYLGIGGLLHTAYQTGKAKSMLSGVPGYEFLDYSDGNTPTVQPIAGGGDSGNTTALLAASPYLVSGTTQVESEASKWYNSIGNNTKQFNFASAYATAKEKVSQTLNNKGPIGMLAVNQSPYYDWLKTNKLDRGIL
jgi:hypothetical protein